jgi:hypothetical protein
MQLHFSKASLVIATRKRRRKLGTSALVAGEGQTEEAEFLWFVWSLDSLTASAEPERVGTRCGSR